MAKQRYVNTKFWSDTWVSDLDPTEKLLFLYLLTNERTNIAGVFELPIKYMSSETGIEKEMIGKVLKRFEKDKKIKYLNGWIIMANFIEHQAINPKIEKGIALIIQNEIPGYIKTELFRLNPRLEYYDDVFLPEGRKKNIRNIVNEIDNCSSCNKELTKSELIVHHKVPLYDGGNNDSSNLDILCVNCHKDTHSKIGYDRLSKASNYTNTNTNTNTNSIAEDKSSKKFTTLGADVIKAFEEVDPKNKTYYNNKTQRGACDFLVEEYGFEKVMKVVAILPKSNLLQYMPVVTTPVQLREKWTQLEAGLRKKKSESEANKNNLII